MSGESANPSCIPHLSIGTSDFPRAQTFCDAMMTALGCKMILEYPSATTYGKLYPGFWVRAPVDSRPANVGNGNRIDFSAGSKAQTNAFHATTLTAGADDGDVLGPHPLYGEPYCGCFICDLDGHKVEASYQSMGRGFNVHNHAH